MEPEGVVIGQTPFVDEVVMSGSEISFVISAGPPASSVTKRFTLPFWQASEIHVRIVYDGQEVYNERVSTMLGYVEYTFTGKGDGHRVKVYYDDVLTHDEEIKFW